MTELFQLSSIYSDKNIFHTSVFISISYMIKSKAVFFFIPRVVAGPVDEPVS